MTEQQHKRALEIKKRIAHIDSLIEFLIELTENPATSVGGKAWLQEIAFGNHAEYQINQADIDCLRAALGEERLKLEQEFKML